MNLFFAFSIFSDSLIDAKMSSSTFLALEITKKKEIDYMWSQNPFQDLLNVINPVIIPNDNFSTVVVDRELSSLNSLYVLHALLFPGQSGFSLTTTILKLLLQESECLNLILSQHLKFSFSFYF